MLLWDLDGTIIDSSGDLARSINLLLKDYGYPPLSCETVVSHIGRGARNLVARCLEEYDHILTSESDHDDALDTFEKHYRAALIVDTFVYPTISDTLHTLAASGRRMALVTNKPELPSIEILELLGLSSCFFTVVGGDTLPARKPDPAPLLLAMERCSVDRERVIMIGDTSIDTVSARRAGVLACGVGWGLGDREAARNADPDWWIEEPSTLSEMLLQKKDCPKHG